jgi:FeS assembly protein IscX
LTSSLGVLYSLGFGAMTDREATLNWESTYAIAVELNRQHAGVDLNGVTLGNILDWTLQLPEFVDDPALSNDEILASIYQEWYEVIQDD